MPWPAFVQSVASVNCSPFAEPGPDLKPCAEHFLAAKSGALRTLAQAVAQRIGVLIQILEARRGLNRCVWILQR